LSFPGGPGASDGEPFHRGQVLPDGGLGHRGPREPLADPPQPAVRQRGPLGGGVVQPPQHGREFLVLAGVTRTAASPVTSGSAPVRLATSGVPEAMCSTAGSEKPSYSDGTTAISALASRAENASSDRPWVNVTRSARDSCAASRSVAGAGWP